MAIAAFLAMTAAEIQSNPVFPHKCGWMACHFSPYGTGLSNLPEALPPGSLLILNDRIPWQSHDPDRIAEQLQEILDTFSCHGLLLDFQRPGCPEAARLCQVLSRQLSCPVGVSALYAEGLSCPVFLPPVPLQMSVESYLAPWQGRECWLELALNAEEILLTAEGSSTAPLPFSEPMDEGHREETLHCRYTLQLSEDSARFTLRRTREGLEALLEAAEPMGVTTAVGLWQELGAYVPCRGGA